MNFGCRKRTILQLKIRLLVPFGLGVSRYPFTLARSQEGGLLCRGATSLKRYKWRPQLGLSLIETIYVWSPVTSLFETLQMAPKTCGFLRGGSSAQQISFQKGIVRGRSIFRGDLHENLVKNRSCSSFAKRYWNTPLYKFRLSHQAYFVTKFYFDSSIARMQTVLR